MLKGCLYPFHGATRPLYYAARQIPGYTDMSMVPVKINLTLVLCWYNFIKNWIIMSMDDIDWRRSLYAGTALSILVSAMLPIFVIPPFKEDSIPGSEWIIIGIQLSIAAIIFGIGYKNKRNSWLTKILLILLGAGVIILGLLGFLVPAVETEMTSVWKFSTRICAIAELIIAFMAFKPAYECRFCWIT